MLVHSPNIQQIYLIINILFFQTVDSVMGKPKTNKMASKAPYRRKYSSLSLYVYNFKTYYRCCTLCNGCVSLFFNFLLRTYCKGVLLSKRRLLDVAHEKLPCLEQNILIYLILPFLWHFFNLVGQWKYFFFFFFLRTFI